MDEIVETRPAPRGAVGRGQGPPEDERVRHVRRPAAAPVHRPRARHRARRAADGRAVLGAGPDLHRAHRGPDDGAQGELLDRHRHPQHAAGGARVGHDGVLHGRARRRRPSTAPATWSSTTRRTRSSRTPTTSARRTTSPASSADGRARPTGVHFQDELRAARGPGARRARPRRSRARPHAGGARAPGHRARLDRRRRRRPARRPLPGGPPGDPLAARAAGAGGRRPAGRGGAAARDQARRAHGRPVREHRQAAPARRATSRRWTTRCARRS